VDAIGGECGLEAAAGVEFGVGLDGGDANNARLGVGEGEKLAGSHSTTIKRFGAALLPASEAAGVF
jgi:hypothetical protein